MPKYESDFAILDVKRGRAHLARRLKTSEEPIPVTIRGFITGTWSCDDSVSQEFNIEVTGLEIPEQ